VIGRGSVNKKYNSIVESLIITTVASPARAIESN